MQTEQNPPAVLAESGALHVGQVRTSWVSSASSPDPEPSPECWTSVCIGLFTALGCDYGIAESVDFTVNFGRFRNGATDLLTQDSGIPSAQPVDQSLYSAQSDAKRLCRHFVRWRALGIADS